MAFPTNKTNAVDNTTDVLASHLNNLEDKVGIDNSTDANSLDYKVSNASSSNPGHKHSGSSLELTTATTTNLTGYLYGDGSNVGTKGMEDGWIPAGETWTYASATTFTISGDKTGKYQIGDKIKLTQTTTKYFYIIGVSYSSPNTTVTVTAGDDYSLANATITSPYFSKVENPQGFPTSFEFTPTITASSGTITTASGSMEFSIKNGLVAISGIIGVTNIGTGSGQLRATLPVLPATYGCGIGRENSVVGTSIHLYIAPSIAYLTAFTYSGGSCVVNNYSIRFSASYYI